MKKLLWTAVLALATTALPAAYADAGPSRDFWRPKNLRQATVDQPSARSFGQGNCGHLVLDERRLRFFLSHARPALRTAMTRKCRPTTATPKGISC